MLPPELLRFRARPEGLVEPAWLAERDDVWLRAVIDALDARVGKPMLDLEADLRRRLEPLARAHAVEPRVLRGVIRVARRTCSVCPPGLADPPLVRSTTFRAAAQARNDSGRLDQLARRAVLQQVAMPLGISADEVSDLLFADLLNERRLAEPDEAITPEGLRARYHLALLQGALLRASQVQVWVREHIRAVARFAKLSGLLCTFDLAPNSTRMTLSGPLALFHSTLKYGRALSRFVPSVLSTPGYRMVAACTINRESMRVAVDASAPLPRSHALPRAADSQLEARLSRDLRRLGSNWTLEREGAAFHVGRSVFFPDFVLRRASARVFVEVVGYWTPEYLASKLKALATVCDVPLVVVVDASRGVVSTTLPHAEVLPFKRWIDAGAVIDAAERAASR